MALWKLELPAAMLDLFEILSGQDGTARPCWTVNRQGQSDMTADDGRLPPRGNTGPGSLKTAERQAREARQDADRYARRGNTTMHAISLQAARDLEAAAAAQRADAPAPRERR
jgi:hypothetical protein